ncbi:MAG: hypothetical protein ACFB15_00900 [Cyclobacteriaceae bacterium]
MDHFSPELRYRASAADAPAWDAPYRPSSRRGPQGPYSDKN